MIKHKHRQEHLSQRQYRSLRRLFILWLKTIIHHKYKTISSFVLIVSLIVNIIFAFSYKSNIKTIKGQTSSILSLYDLKKLPSVASEKTFLDKRFDKLYRDYLKDKEKPDHFYYDKTTEEAQKWWKDNCVLKLRRIINIRTRLRDIEQTMLTITNDENMVFDIIRLKKYEEILADMSNYYSSFIPLENYRYLISSSD